MLDHGFNFMNTKIYNDNESTICIVKNPTFHSKTKHIEIRHHFIRDAYKKKLIQVLKIHTDDNVADLLNKAFDVSRFLQIVFRNQLRDVPVPMDHFPVPALTKKVLTFMVKKGKTFSGNVTHVFHSMLVQPIEDEGEVSERPSESQPIPSPTHPSKDQPESQPNPSPRPSSFFPIPDSDPEGSNGNHGAAEIKDLKAQIKQLKKKTRPIINHHKAWFRAARLKKHQKKKDMEKSKKRRSVSKQGRKAVKYSKGASSVQTHTDWDGLDTDLEATLNEAMDYTLAQNEGKTDSKVEEPKTSSKTRELHLSGDTLVVEDKGTAEKGGSTKGTDLQQSTVKSDE
ncbi:hypothetical protein Tco_1455056, partial [Tanacetum coccineum]